MKIETKYNINQEVWFMHYNKPRKDKPFRVEYTYDCEKGEEEIYYLFKKVFDIEYLMDDKLKEAQVFDTKEELIASL